CKSDFNLRSKSNKEKDKFRARETGKSWMNEFRTKFFKEVELKLPKILKDMMIKLMKKVEWDEEKCAKIQIVRVVYTSSCYLPMLSIGLMFMSIYLDNLKGYISRI
ncbi:5460_t:CDS:2, partial [Racocetra fulgida]